MDLGFGPQTVEFPGFGPFIGGEFMNSLAETGVAREDVTAVIYTHLHLDHVGWTSMEVDGKREVTFPNAKTMCTKADWDFWLNAMGLEPASLTFGDGFDHDDAAIRAAVHGNGMVLATRLSVISELAEGSLVELPGAMPVEMGGYYLLLGPHKERTTRQFRTWLKKELDDLQEQGHMTKQVSTK